MPLLLSPAGSPAALKAAVDSGADEVYLGGSAFNARLNAGNFDKEALRSARKLCSGANVGLHITLNTLVYDRELESALEYVDFLANDIRPDALIIQDLGLLTAVRERFPELCVHASTQMRIHSAEDAFFLKSLGVTRAVLARELPFEDIREFVSTGIETEIFVHGAICVSESGGCLMSSVIGNRSGNRGECAQPCRLPYREKEKHPLSLKDFCLARHITEITDAGVTSLKIEGRMKSPDYVAAVTSVYRRLLDERRDANEREMRFLADVFSRSGFTDGFFTGKLGKGLFGVRSESDKEKSALASFKAPKYPPREAREGVTPTPISLPEREDEKTFSPKLQRGLVLRFEQRLPSEGLLSRVAEAAARIDVPLALATDARLVPYADKISVILPRSIFSREREGIKKQLTGAYAVGIRHATVSSFNQLRLCDGFYLHADYAFNVANRKTLSAMERFGFSSVMLSPETDGKFARGSACALEYLAYGRTPLMYTRACIIENLTGCQHKEQCSAVLTDRTGARFPIYSGNGHTNTIYNSLPRYSLDKSKELKKSGVGLLTLLFTDESDKQILEMISISKTDKKPSFPYTRR